MEIAKFLQDTVEESALVKSGSGKHNELAKEFKDFLTEVRYYLDVGTQTDRDIFVAHRLAIIF